MSTRRLAVLASHPIQYQAELYRRLSAEPGLDVTVFFGVDDGSKPYFDRQFNRYVQWDIPLLDGYRHVFLRNYSPRPHGGTFFGLLTPGLFRELVPSKFDAVMMNGWGNAMMWLGIAAAAVNGVPILMRGESTLLDSTARWKHTAKQIVLPVLFRSVDTFLAIGTENARFYEAWNVPRSRVVIAPYSVDNDRFLAEASNLASRPNKVRGEFGIPTEHPIILFAGKLKPAKDPLLLIRAFAEVRRKSPCSLLIVGEGTLREPAERLISDLALSDVHFAGFKNQTEMGEYYSAADLFVLPSSHEPWGLVINEAMCFSLPIVASNKVGAAADLVHHGENGFVFQSGDARALADAIAAVVANEALRLSMGSRSRAIIEAWSYREVVDAIRHLPVLNMPETVATA